MGPNSCELDRGAQRAAKAIQDKRDRLDEAFLFERSIDIETYERHAEKFREDGELDEVAVEVILGRSQNVSCCVPPTYGCRRHSNNASGSNNSSFRTKSRSTKWPCSNRETALASATSGESTENEGLVDQTKLDPSVSKPTR
jgi:hypothetical protein